MAKLSQKTALVTGSSRGLGRDMALRLAEHGASVIVTYHSNEIEAQNVVSQIKKLGSDAVALQLDQSDIATFDSFKDRVTKALTELNATKLDILVCNAGIGVYEMVQDSTEKNVDSLIDIHFKGVLFLTKTLAPILNDNGRIINISSGLTRFTFPGYGVYSAMKGAIEVLTRFIAKEFAPRNITANVVAPGAIDTDFNKATFEANPGVVKTIESVTTLRRVGHADDIGGVVAFLASDDAKWITGQRIEVSGGMFL